MLSRAHSHGALVDALTLPASRSTSAEARRLISPTAALLAGGVLLLAMAAWYETLLSMHLLGAQVAGTSVTYGALVAGGVGLGALLAAIGLGREVTLVVGGVLFLALAARAQITLPFTPVPVTGQTFAVLLLGAAYGWRRGFTTTLVYVLGGTAGLPFFAAVTGSATFGYLLGFVLAAGVVGWLAEHGWDRTLPRSLAAMLAGEVVIFLCGLTWLAQFTGWSHVVALGLAPFVVGDALKLLAAALVLPAAWWLTERAASREKSL